MIRVLFKSMLAGFVAVSFFSVSVAFAQSAQVATPVQQSTPTVDTGPPSIADNICKGVMSAETGSYDPNTTISSCQETADSSLGYIAKRIINVFSIVVGVVSVIMIIVGGFRYIISGGDSSSVQGAKNTILYAIVGLVIVVFAQVIIRFVLTNLAPAAG